MDRFDPRGRVNRALLVGVSEYDNTSPPHGVPGALPAVGHNLARLSGALRDGGVFQDDEITVCPSPSLDDFNDALHKAVGAAQGLLLFYFAGHGAIPSAADELFLQMRNARVVAGGHAVFRGADGFTDVLTVLASSRAQRVVVVLDCCFAGNAARLWEAEADRQRVLLLMGVQANHRIDMGDETTPTAFTARLAELLEQHGEVSFRQLAEPLWTYLSEHHRTLRGDPWEPQSRTGPETDVLLAAREPEPEAPFTVDPGRFSGPSPEPPSGPSPEESTAPHPLPPPGGSGPGALRRDVVAAVAVAAVRQLRRAPGAVRSWFLRLSPGRRVGAGVLALCVLGALTYGGVTLLSPGRSSCAPPLELRLLTDPDLEPTVRAAADAYLTSDADTDGHGCRRTGITVYSAGAADTVAALHAQSGAWQEPLGEEDNPQRDIGPQPDIWIPASAADVDRVIADQNARTFAELEPDPTALAYSPIVLALPQKLTAGSPETRTGRTLSQLLTAVRRQGGEVRRPDPEFTTAALLATTGLYGTGAADDAGRAERQLAPGPPAPTAAELLCTLPDDDATDNRTAALVPEFLLKSGVGCDRTTRTERTAQYPADVPGLDPTFVRVRWDGADRDGPRRDEAAARFRSWLGGEDGLKVFARDGFRSGAVHRVLLAAPGTGVLRAPWPLTGPAGAEAVETALNAYRRAGGSGRVLFLLDSSGSMGGRWEGPSGGPGILKQSLGGLGEQDEYGVWAVALTPGAEQAYSVLLPFGRHPRGAAERTLDREADVRDAEADPRAALLAALDDMAGRGTDDDRPQLIVYLTDDEDNTRLTGRNLDEVLRRARTARVPVAMVSLESGGCDPGEPDARISAASGGRCLDADGDLGAGLQDEVARTGTGDD